MTTVLLLAWKSAWSRRFALCLTFLSIMLSVTMLLAVERLRHGARESFAASVSGTDLIVGPRSHPLQLLLYAVFHIGTVDAGMSWKSVERIAADPAVAWTIPLTLGDSHHGYPVVSTSAAYFDHYQYGRRQPLSFAAGTRFHQLFDVVLGAEVARRLHYRVGDQLTLEHGLEEIGHAGHADRPFTVTGILAPTGTPVDRTLHIGLEAMQALHLDWQGGAHIPGVHIKGADLHKFDLRPTQVTAVLVGLKQRAAVLRVQRTLPARLDEPLSAVMSGAALDQLWRLTGDIEGVLRAVSAIVLVVALAGLAAAVLAGLNERRREMAVLRAVGASPRHVFLLMLCEGLGLSLAGSAAGFVVVQLASFGLAPALLARFELTIDIATPGPEEWLLLMAVVGAGLCVSILPGWRAYRLSLADGLSPKV
ncbi:MAG: ABC transporter permease [Pseudomonadota bacterium]|nr:ABC transporter permease [Pseudomonadota bacterium]